MSKDIWSKHCQEAKTVGLDRHILLNHLLGMKDARQIERLRQQVEKVARQEGVSSLHLLDRTRFPGRPYATQTFQLLGENVQCAPYLLRLAQFVLEALSWFRKKGLKDLTLMQWTALQGELCFLCVEWAPIFDLQVKRYIIWDHASILKKAFQLFTPDWIQKHQVYGVKSLKELQTKENQLCLLSIPRLSYFTPEEQNQLFKPLRRYFQHGMVMWAHQQDPEESFFQLSPRFYEHMVVKSPQPLLHLHERWFLF